MSVAYAYENGWDIGAGARGGHMMLPSQNHVCGGADAPSFHHSVIRGLSAISKYIHTQPAAPGSPPVLTHRLSLRCSFPLKPPHPVSTIEPSCALQQGLLAAEEGSVPTASHIIQDDGQACYPLVSAHACPSPSPSASSSASSSIGEARDDTSCSSQDDSGQGMEAESEYRGPLDLLADLKSSLPIKRGLSRFFDGKSRSFTSLADVAALSDAKDLAKVEHPFNRKRKVLGSGGHHRCFPPLPSAAGVSKRTAATNRSTLALAVSMIGEQDQPPASSSSSSSSSASRRGRQFGSAPPRSSSLTDLQDATKST